MLQLLLRWKNKGLSQKPTQNSKKKNVSAKQPKKKRNAKERRLKKLKRR